MNTPAPAPTVNVNVRNVYSNKNNKVEEHNENIGRVENTVVNNNAKYNQELSNRVSNNLYTDNQVTSVIENNPYKNYFLFHKISINYHLWNIFYKTINH